MLSTATPPYSESLMAAMKTIWCHGTVLKVSVGGNIVIAQLHRSMCTDLSSICCHFLSSNNALGFHWVAAGPRIQCVHSEPINDSKRGVCA